MWKGRKDLFNFTCLRNVKYFCNCLKIVSLCFWTFWTKPSDIIVRNFKIRFITFQQKFSISEMLNVKNNIRPVFVVYLCFLNERELTWLCDFHYVFLIKREWLVFFYVTIFYKSTETDFSLSMVLTIFY